MIEKISADFDVVVDFPEQIGWRGKLQELTKVRRGQMSKSPKRARKAGVSNNSKLLLIAEAEKIIEESSASSNPEMLPNLFDKDKKSFWKSSMVDQSKKEIWIEFKIREELKIDQLKLRLDKNDFREGDHK